MNKDTARQSEAQCTSIQCSVTLDVCWRPLLLETRHYFLRSAKEITPKSVIQVPPWYLLIVAWLHSQETMCLAQNLTCRSEKFRDMLVSHVISNRSPLPVLLAACIPCPRGCSWDLSGVQKVSLRWNPPSSPAPTSPSDTAGAMCRPLQLPKSPAWQKAHPEPLCIQHVLQAS